MTKYRYMGSHASQVAVGDRHVPVEPGDFVELEKSDLDNEDNAWLFDGNLLKSLDDFAAKTTKPAATASGSDS